MMTHRYFWRAAPAILALFAVSAGAQTCPSSSALYPSGLDGDAQLAVASNGVATYLNAALTAGATTFSPVSSAGMVANMYLSIDSEIVFLTATSPLTIARGCDGTVAAGHLNRAAVQGRINAGYHNSLSKAVKAIEANIPAGGLSPGSYNWPAQTPGVALVALGVNQSVPLNPMPAGITSACVNACSVYISGGTGTAEATLVTGWTSTAITVTPANAHSGAWTVQSASSGIQEALISTSGLVFIPAGTYPIYGQIAINGTAVVTCASHDSVLLGQTTTQNMLVITTGTTGNRVRVNNCQFATAPQPKTAGDAIQVNGSGGVANYGFVADGLVFQNQWNCIHIASGTHYSIVNSNFYSSINWDLFLQDTLNIDDGDSSVVGNVFDGLPTGAGVHWESGGGVKFVSNKFLAHTYGLQFLTADGTSTSDIFIIGNSIEDFGLAGISIDRMNTTGQLQEIVISSNEFAPGITGTRGITLGEQGGHGGVVNVLIENNELLSSQFGIIVSNTSGAKIDNNFVDGTTYGIYFSSGNSGLLSAVENQMINETTPYVGRAIFVDHLNIMTFLAITAVTLGPANGSQVFCSDCNSTCTANGGTGRTCFYENGAWVH